MNEMDKFEILQKHHDFMQKDGEKPSEYIEDRIIDAMEEYAQLYHQDKVKNLGLFSVSVSNFTKDEFELMKYATWVLLRQTEATTPRFPRLNKLKQKLEELYKKHYSR